FVCCCARAASGHAMDAAPPPSSVMNSLRFMPTIVLPALCRIARNEHAPTPARAGRLRQRQEPQRDQPGLGLGLDCSEPAPRRAAAVAPSSLPGYREFGMTINDILPRSSIRAVLPAPFPACTQP